ncbi:MAG: phospholipase D-like domain-containing protein [Geminicoccaceae bacterium]
MRELARRSQQFWIATAFVGGDAVEDVISTARASGAKVRLLTGTFGNNTRKATYERLLELQERSGLEARIWDSGRHRRFHGKLYLWRMSDGSKIAWIGSSNFTAGGLQEEGELVLELRDQSGAGTLAQLRRFFLREWDRGQALDAAFVDRYSEAARPAPDIRTAPLRGRRRSRSLRRAPTGGFIANLDRVLGERRAEELAALLSGTARDALFFVSPTKSLSWVKAGDRGLVVNHVDGDAALVEVIDAVPVGRSRLVAYEPLFARRARLDWSAALARRAGRTIGASASGRRLRGRRLTPAEFEKLSTALYPGRRLP